MTVRWEAIGGIQFLILFYGTAARNSQINELKQEGRIKPKPNSEDNAVAETTGSGGILTQQRRRRSVSDEYADKLSAKFGGKRGRQVGRMLGIDVPVSGTTAEPSAEAARKPKLGALDLDELEQDDEDDLYPDEPQVLTEEQRREQAEISSEAASDAIKRLRDNIDRSKRSENEDDRDDQDMVDAVAAALEKKGSEYRSQASLDVISSEDASTSIAVTPPVFSQAQSAVSQVASSGQATSGVGGAWAPPAEEKDADYQPKVGTWGAFPRPRNISTAYGGGKRVGAEVRTDEKKRQESIESTKERLRAYRERMGIVVQSEIDNKEIIDEALALAGRAMLRGSYSVGVSALEKVTQYCSTKSKLGGKVFLELAMAYEAEGKTDQAIGLYAALTKSPIEQIKMNADKLLYGLEAMNFMRNEAKLKEFSRKNAAATFIDATGFGEISKNFEDSKIYNTAYVDLDSKGSQYYKMLSENVVRSTREARQILLKAVAASEVDRLKVVQALRSFSRHFDEALEVERKAAESKNVPVDYAGRPIVNTRRSAEDDLASAIGMGGFVLGKAEQTLADLSGEWRLQLMADKRGEGVDFFNSTTIWQAIDSETLTYETAGFESFQSGELTFESNRRLLSRINARKESGGMSFLSKIFGGGGNAAASTMSQTPQQVLTVDPALLITRAVVKVPATDNVKDYYSVWRRTEPGTYSGEGR